MAKKVRCPNCDDILVVVDKAESYTSYLCAKCGFSMAWPTSEYFTGDDDESMG